MSIYAQQASSLMERLPVTEQIFVLEFIKKISINNSSSNEINIKQLNKKQREVAKRFIESVNSATDEVLDNEFDEIVKNRVNINRELDL